MLPFGTKRNENKIADIWNDYPGMEEGFYGKTAPFSWDESYLTKTKGIIHIVVLDKIKIELEKLGATSDSIINIPAIINRKFFTIDNKIDRRSRSQLFAGASEEYLVIITNDRIVADKRSEMPITVANKISGLYPKNENKRIIFACYGAWNETEYGREIARIVRKSRFSDHNNNIVIITKESVSNTKLPYILSQADLSFGFHFVPPEISKAWGMSFAEAWAVGLPVITWENPGDILQGAGQKVIRKFFKYQRIIDDTLIEYISKCILKYLNESPQIRKRRRGQIRNMAQNVLNPQYAVDKYVNLFKAV